MERIFIGVDGGGTKTTAVAVNQNGDILASCVGEGINFYTSSMKQARNTLKRLIDDLLSKISVPNYELLCIGMSALDEEPSDIVLKEFCGDVFDYRKVIMHSDVYMALFGLTQGEPGILIISGTGMMGVATDKSGKMFVSGGWGYLFGDEGGSYYIGLEGIKAALQDYESIGCKTSLTARLLDFYKLENYRALIEFIYSKEKVNDVIASFAQEVLKAFREGDSVSIKIIESAIDILVGHTQNLMNGIQCSNAKIGTFGGLFEKNNDIYTTYQKKLLANNPNATVKLLDTPPYIGAILYGLYKTQCEDSMHIIETIKRSIQ